LHARRTRNRRPSQSPCWPARPCRAIRNRQIGVVLPTPCAVSPVLNHEAHRADAAPPSTELSASFKARGMCRSFRHGVGRVCGTHHMVA
jgi:hypothetical protein